MKQLMMMLALAGFVLSAPAAEPAKAGAATAKPGVQQAKAEREPVKTSTRKPPSAKQKAQQEKMKACNASAKGKHGDERKAFMKDCLRTKA